MPSRKTRILILYATAGFGHRSAAIAVDEALQEKYAYKCETFLINPLEDERTPLLLRDLQSDYDRILQHVPELYKIGYEFSDAGFPITVVDGVLILMLYDVMAELVDKYHPDIIVATYPLYQAALDAVFTIKQKSIPIVTVITDLVSVHRIWFNIGVDLYLVPTNYVAESAANTGIVASRIKVTGIPIHPKIIEQDDPKKEILTSLGLDNSRFTILVTGSKRMEGMPETLHGLNHSALPVQFILVAGGDQSLYQSFQQTLWHVPVKIFDFVDFIPRLMHASDALICKAGGLIVSEAMACGLPVILTNVLPGQEAGNAEYVLERGAGDMVQDSAQLLETVFHWLQNDREMYKIRAQAAVDAGFPQAAYNVADIIWDAANKKPAERTVTHLVERTRLMQTLKRYRRSLINDISHVN